jgi:hypothetical protein
MMPHVDGPDAATAARPGIATAIRINSAGTVMAVVLRRRAITLPHRCRAGATRTRWRSSSNT